MLYLHHGLGVDFSNYGMYFDSTVDEDAYTYLTLANAVIHTVRPDALTVAEDVSGMPGIGAPIAECGVGFDYRMAMGVPECWFKLVRDIRDEDWSVGFLWHELTNRRADERTVSYVESHDQALVGGKSFIFQMIDKEMYFSMHVGSDNLYVKLMEGRKRQPESKPMGNEEMIARIYFANAPKSQRAFADAIGVSQPYIAKCLKKYSWLSGYRLSKCESTDTEENKL